MCILVYVTPPILNPRVATAVKRIALACCDSFRFEGRSLWSIASLNHVQIRDMSGNGISSLLHNLRTHSRYGVQISVQGDPIVILFWQRGWYDSMSCDPNEISGHVTSVARSFTLRHVPAYSFRMAHRCACNSAIPSIRLTVTIFATTTKSHLDSLWLGISP